MADRVGCKQVTSAAGTAVATRVQALSSPIFSELVPNEPKLLCAIQTSPNTFMHVAKLGLEGNIPSLLCGDGIDYWTSGGFRSKSCICFFVECCL